MENQKVGLVNNSIYEKKSFVEEAGIFSRLFFSWGNPLVKRANKNGKLSAQDDFGGIATNEKLQINAKKLYDNYQAQKNKNLIGVIF